MKLRIVFMGSPDFALPSLASLAEHYPVVGVVTQPDKPAGRGQVLSQSPVKHLALSLGIPIIQPGRLRELGVLEQLQSWQPDLIVVAAFGQILRQNILEFPPFGCLNVHASLLPRWRGAAPIQAAILAGDENTGATIMKMDVGVDTGDVLAQRVVKILPDDNAESLTGRLARIGAELLLETLPGYLAGELTPAHQDEQLATHAVLIHKGDGLLSFDKPAIELERQVRAYFPWPGAFFEWQGAPLKVLKARAVHEGKAIPGSKSVYRGFPALGTQVGLLVCEEVQPAGKKPMPGNAFLKGARQWLTP